MIGAGQPSMTIFMGKLTDTFIKYEFFDQMTKFPNATNFYNTDLFEIVDPLYFLELVQKEFPFYDFNTTRIRLELSLEEFVEQLNSTAFHGGTQYKVVFKEEANSWSLYMVCVAIGFVVCGYAMVSALSTAANNQAHRIRILFFKSILKQDIKWYDTKTSGDFATKVTA